MRPVFTILKFSYDSYPHSSPALEKKTFAQVSIWHTRPNPHMIILAGADFRK